MTERPSEPDPPEPEIDEPDAGIPLEPVEIEPPPPPVVRTAPAAACRTCGYNVEGLLIDGRCPECGFPIQRTLAADVLANSSPEYLAALHTGAVAVLTSIILMIVIGVTAFIVTIAITMPTGDVPPHWLTIVSAMLQLPISLLLVWGWWRLSTPDPAYTGRDDGSTARRVVRVMLVIAGAAAVCRAAVSLFPQTNVFVLTGAGIGVVAFIAFAVRYFAEMLYLQWLTPRIPDQTAYKQARLLIWLGPVLFVVLALCFYIGPLIALILYCLLIDTVRRDLKAIRAAM